MSHTELAMLCQQSYDPEGIPGADDIGGLGARCFILKAKGGPKATAILVFRGTADTAGWIQNCQTRKEPFFFPAGEVHAGFLECWESLRSRALKSIGKRPVVITGHSLGGAMATLAAVTLASQVREVVTFGAPRVGNGEFVRSYRHKPTKTTRYVHESDPVPLVPGWLAGFRHVCSATWYNGDSWGGMGFWAWLKMACVQLLCDREHLWADHAIDHYIAALAEHKL